MEIKPLEQCLTCSSKRSINISYHDYKERAALTAIKNCVKVTDLDLFIFHKKRIILRELYSILCDDLYGKRI